MVTIKVLPALRFVFSGLSAFIFGALLSFSSLTQAQLRTGDRTPPTVVINKPVNGSQVSGVIPFEVVATDNIKVYGVVYSIDGQFMGDWLNAPTVMAFNWDTRAYPDGPHTITITARDYENNQGSASVSFVISNNGGADVTLPMVSISSPAIGATMRGVFTATAAASDNVGVSGVQFKLDDINVGTEIRSAPYTLTIDTKTFTNGSHTLTAVARDATGNIKTSAPVSIIVNNSTSTTPNPPQVIGTLVKAATCKAADVQAAIDSANDGDTVQIPAGTCAWTQGVTIGARNSFKSVSLVGAGCDLNADGRPNACRTVISHAIPETTTGQKSAVAAYVKENTAMEITGITWCHTPSGDNVAFTMFTIAGQGNRWRIHHNRFENLDNSIRAIVTGWPYGVIDHNYFYELANAAILVGAPTWKGVSGNGSAAAPLNLGGDDAVYIEDNTFENATYPPVHSQDCDNGGRFVTRFNIMRNFASGNHGTEGAITRGCQKVEVYENSFSNHSPVSAQRLHENRGGNGVFFNNTAEGKYHMGAFFTLYRTESNHPDFGWGNCTGFSVYDKNDGVTYTTGAHTGANGTQVLQDVTQAWTPNQWVGYGVKNLRTGLSARVKANDATTMTLVLTLVPNRAANGIFWQNGDPYEVRHAYPCLDQMGWSGGDLLTTVNGVSMPQAWPHQTLTPFYVWGNILNGETAIPKIHGIAVGVYQANRDYYYDATAFDGKFGVGVGPIAARPKNCTPGVGYWTTDEGEWNNNHSGPDGRLYKCTAANIWTLYYTPYFYPHPLTY